MKRIVSFALAVIMVFGLAALSFADNSSNEIMSEEEWEAHSFWEEIGATRGVNKWPRVKYDMKGNVRLTVFVEQDVVVSDYAEEYYETFFASDDEVHFIVNRGNDTTTKITCYNNWLTVTVTEYQELEEFDGRILGKGDRLYYYTINLESGEITGTGPRVTAAAEESAENGAPAGINSLAFIESNEPVETEEPIGERYILNTRSKKIHLPTCSSVNDIAANNYREFYGTIAELLAEGYTACGRCNPN